MSVFPKKEPYLIFSLGCCITDLAEKLFGGPLQGRMNVNKIIPAYGNFKGEAEQSFIMRWRDLSTVVRLFPLLDLLVDDDQTTVLYIDENRESWLRPVRGITTVGKYIGYAQVTPYRPEKGTDYTAVTRSDYKGTDYIVCSRKPVKGAVPNGH